MALPKTAFVLAAGRGERLRPFTDTTPKPLLPLQGKPILTHILDRLEVLKLDRVVLNAWHLSDQIVRFAEQSTPFYSFELIVSCEESLLGTGGGLKKALPLIGETPFLMMNGDCFWSGDLKTFVQKAAAQEGVESVWELTDLHPQQTKIEFSNKQLMSVGELWKDPSLQKEQKVRLEQGCFSGIQLIKKIESNELPDQGCLVRNYFLKRLESGAKLGVEHGHLEFWEDVGTPERYQALQSKA